VNPWHVWTLALSGGALLMIVWELACPTARDELLDEHDDELPSAQR